MYFSNAIVRTPGSNFCEGITTAHLGKPDFQKALKQHAEYVNALETCNVAVTTLPPLSQFPDSVFVEDTAVVTEKCAVICRPGAQTRQGEEKSIEKILNNYRTIEYITPPGTLEGGDVLRAEDHFYIGLSSRTNKEGAGQLVGILKKYGYSGSAVSLKHLLHLKTGIAYIGKSIFLTAGELIHHPEFKNRENILVEDKEAYAANAIAVNGSVLIPSGFPLTRKNIESAGFPVIELDVSEFQKMDGGLSCLSLRF